MTTPARGTDPVPARLQRLLAEAGVDHGPLSRVGRTGNHTYTDHTRVFIKVNRTDEPTAATTLTLEPRAARWARTHGLNALTPLLDQPLPLGPGPHPGQVATVWPYRAPADPPDTSDALAALAAAAAATTAAPAPRWAPDLDWADLLHRGTDRLRALPPNASIRRLDAVLRRAFDAAATVLGRAARRPDLVATHGDLHPGNLHPTTVETLVIDWETFTRAPREWEYGTYAALACTWPGTPVSDPLTHTHTLHSGLDHNLLVAVARLRVANCLTRLLTDHDQGEWFTNLTRLLHTLDQR